MVGNGVCCCLSSVCRVVGSSFSLNRAECHSRGGPKSKGAITSSLHVVGSDWSLLVWSFCGFNVPFCGFNVRNLGVCNFYFGGDDFGVDWAIYWSGNSIKSALRFELIMLRDLPTLLGVGILNPLSACLVTFLCYFSGFRPAVCISYVIFQLARLFRFAAIGMVSYYGLRLQSGLCINLGVYCSTSPVHHYRFLSISALIAI